MLILTHRLYLRTPEGPKPIPIRVYQPAIDDEFCCWGCRFEIDWPHGRKTMSGYGQDTLQALTIALQLVGTHIYVSDYHADGLLFAYEQEEGYGFPVPANIRDLLVGVDKMVF